MKFETAATTNPIDQLKVIGKPLSRIDGSLKTTGTARYAYERHDTVPNPAYGYVVGSAIAKGKIASIDLNAAKAAFGVLAIVTADNAGKLTKGKLNVATLLGGPDIEHYHQAIAVVVAETFEQARAAAQLIRVDYASATGAFDLAAVTDDAGIGQQPFQLGRCVARDLLWIEAVIDAAIVFALAQHRDPRQAGLTALERQQLEQRAVVLEGLAPFGIVVFLVQRVSRGPAASRLAIAAGHCVVLPSHRGN